MRGILEQTFNFTGWTYWINHCGLDLAHLILSSAILLIYLQAAGLPCIKMCWILSLLLPFLSPMKIHSFFIRRLPVLPLDSFNVAERFTWKSKRKLQRPCRLCFA